MNIHDKTYSMETSRLGPDEPRKPITLFERFRADPRGAASYPEWLNDRVWELLQRPARVYRDVDGKRYSSPDTDSVRAADCIMVAMDAHKRHPTDRIWVALSNGTMLKQWLPETKYSHNVEKT